MLFVKGIVMSQACWLNGSLSDLGEVQVSIDSAAMRYAQVAFDGCAAVRGATGRVLRILDLDAHLSRFQRSCAGLGLPLRYSPGEIADAVVDVAGRHVGGTAVGIRLFAFAPGEEFIGDAPASVCVFLRSLAGYAPDRPLTLAVADDPRPARTDLPRWLKATAHYAGARRGVLQARRAGKDDILFRNESGRITESSRASLLILDSGGLVLPPVEEGVLPGVTRELLTVVAKGAFGLTAEYRPLELSHVKNSDGAILCSSSLGAAVVGEIDGQCLPVTAATELARAFADAACGKSRLLDDVVTTVELRAPEES